MNEYEIINDYFKSFKKEFEKNAHITKNYPKNTRLDHLNNDELSNYCFIMTFRLAISYFDDYNKNPFGHLAFGQNSLINIECLGQKK